MSRRNNNSVGRRYRPKEDENPTTSTTTLQKIVFPWDTSDWAQIRKRIIEPITNIISLDSKITALSGKLKPRTVSTALEDLFSSGSSMFGAKIPTEAEVISAYECMQLLLDNAHKTFKSKSRRYGSTHILLPGITSNNCFTKLQVATILASCCIGVPLKLSKGIMERKHFCMMDITNIFTNKNYFAITCLVEYFLSIKQLATDYFNGVQSPEVDTFVATIIVLGRRCVDKPHNWITDSRSIIVPRLSRQYVDEASLFMDGEVGPSKIHTVFNHEIILKGNFKQVLNHEEIAMLVRPESLIAAIFCPKLLDTETVQVIGAEKIAIHDGYGSNTKYKGRYLAAQPMGYNADNTETIIRNIMLFMDASEDSNTKAQYLKNFDRDLDKAHNAFSYYNDPKADQPIEIASGVWVYGLFGGNHYVKFIQQLLAASAAGKQLVYCCNNSTVEGDIEPFINWLGMRDVAIADLYGLYLDLVEGAYDNPKLRINEFNIFKEIMDEY